jgi:Tol biopolymer transport system component
MSRFNGQLTRREFLTTAASFASLPLIASAGEAARPRVLRISYFCNGEIHVNEVGKPEGKPLTTGHMDFKPSWSRTGDLLVCFRRIKDDPVTANWKSAIFVIRTDGAEFHTLSDGTHTDFNPTWTRDGSNSPIWNRKNEKTAGFHVMQSKVGGTPGEETAITDGSFHTWAHSCLTDGRILVSSLHPAQGFGLYLLSRKEDAEPIFERVHCALPSDGEVHRASISPSEKRICFEFLKGHQFTEPGHALYIADFDARQRTISNLKAIANADRKPVWFAYPRWIDGESAVIYHSTQTGKGQLYVYRLEDGSMKRVSTNPQADYRYPHGKAAPC